MTHDETAPVVPDASIQVDDVDAAGAELVAADRSSRFPAVRRRPRR